MSTQPWQVTLFTSPTFAFICALAFATFLLVYYWVTGREFPRIRGKHKDTEFEVSPADASTPTAEATPPVAEVGAPAAEEVSAIQTQDPTFSLSLRLYEKKSEGLWQLIGEWSKIQAELDKLLDSDREYLEVTYLQHRIALGDTSALNELGALASKNSLWRRPTMLLANHYFQTNDLRRARDWSLQTIERAQAKREHSQSFALNVKIEAQLNPAGVSELGREYIRVAPTQETKAAVLIAMAEIAVASKDFEQAAILYQAAIDVYPESIDNRFASAFAISDSAEHRLFAYAHYRRLEKTSPDRSFVLNNLAYVCDEINDAALYGYYLERATRVDKAWATVNVANKLAETGFLELAEKAIAELDEDDRNTERVASAREGFARIKKNRDEGQKALDTRSDQYARFFSSLADDFIKNAPEESPIGLYSTAGQTLSVTNSDGRISVQFQRNGRVFTGDLTKTQRHYRGRIKTQGANALSKSAAQVRVLITRDSAHLLFEELNYAETKTENAELLVLGRVTI